MEFEATIVYEKNWNAINELNEKGERKYRYIINIGSSRSSKTVSLIDVYDTYARSQNNKRMTVWRDTKTDCKKTVLNDTLKRLKKTGRYKVGQNFNKTESIFTYDTDSTFEIHGTDDEETVHGLTQDVSWFNEPYKISKDTFDQIDQRTSDFVLLDLNPKKDHWSDDLMKDPRTLVIRSTFKDNPFCPEEQKQKILSYQPIKLCYLVVNKTLTEELARFYDIEVNNLNLSEKHLKELSRCRLNESINSASEYKWQVYGLGEKAERPNRIFHWTEIPIDAFNAIKAPDLYAVDWGAVDPMGVLHMKYYDGGLYLHELNYDSENKIREKLTATELAQIDNTEEGLVMWKFRKMNINPEKVIVCDSNRPLKILALRRAGFEYSISATKGAGSVIDGIDLLNSLKVYYTNTSANLKYEQENYSRKVDRYGIVLEEPEDTDNHLMDPARYGAEYWRKEGLIRNI